MFKNSLLQHIPKRLWKSHIAEMACHLEKWRNIFISEASHSATNASDIEVEFGVAVGKADKLIDVWLNRVNASLHGGNGITVALQAHALPPYCTKPLYREARRLTTMVTFQIAAEHKHLIVVQCVHKSGRHAAKFLK